MKTADGVARLFTFVFYRQVIDYQSAKPMVKAIKTKLKR
jgi:hypothetical protein